MLLCILEVVESGFYSLEVMRRVLLCMLETLDGELCSLAQSKSWFCVELAASRAKMVKPTAIVAIF